MCRRILFNFVFLLLIFISPISTTYNNEKYILQIENVEHKENLVHYNESTIIYYYEEWQTDTFTCTTDADDYHYPYLTIQWVLKDKYGNDNTEEAYRPVVISRGKKFETLIRTKPLHSDDDGSVLICQIIRLGWQENLKTVLFRFRQSNDISPTDVIQIVEYPGQTDIYWTYEKNTKFSCKLLNTNTTLYRGLWWEYIDSHGYGLIIDNPKYINETLLDDLVEFDSNNINNEDSTLECHTNAKMNRERLKVTIHILKDKNSLINNNVKPVTKNNTNVDSTVDCLENCTKEYTNKKINKSEEKNIVHIENVEHKENFVHYNESTIIYYYEEGQTDNFTCTIDADYYYPYLSIQWLLKDRYGNIREYEPVYPDPSNNYEALITTGSLNVDVDGYALICQLIGLGRQDNKKTVLLRFRQSNVAITNISANDTDISSTEKNIVQIENVEHKENLVHYNESTIIYYYEEGQTDNFTCTIDADYYYPYLSVQWLLKDRYGNIREYEPVYPDPSNNYEALITTGSLNLDVDGYALICQSIGLGRQNHRKTVLLRFRQSNVAITNISANDTDISPTEKNIVHIENVEHKENLVHYNESTIIYYYEEGQTDNFTCTIDADYYYPYLSVQWLLKDRYGNIREYEPVYPDPSNNYEALITTGSLNLDVDGYALICQSIGLGRQNHRKTVLLRFRQSNVAITNISANDTDISPTDNNDFINHNAKPVTKNNSNVDSTVDCLDYCTKECANENNNKSEVNVVHIQNSVHEDNLVDNNGPIIIYNYDEGQYEHFACTLNFLNRKAYKLYDIWWLIKDSNGKILEEYETIKLNPNNNYKAILETIPLYPVNDGGALICVAKNRKTYQIMQKKILLKMRKSEFSTTDANPTVTDGG